MTYCKRTSLFGLPV